MKVTTHRNAPCTYAQIETPTTSLNVLLDPNLSASTSLIESAMEMREKGESLLKRAKLIAVAATKI